MPQPDPIAVEMPHDVLLILFQLIVLCGSEKPVDDKTLRLLVDRLDERLAKLLALTHPALVDNTRNRMRFGAGFI
jgi:hypothetical protein